MREELSLTNITDFVDYAAAPSSSLDDWRATSRERALKLFPNKGTHRIAVMMACSSRYAIDYLEQAPALMTFASWGSKSRRLDERGLIASRFGKAVEHGGKLKQLLGMYGAPLPIRKFHGSVVCFLNAKILLNLRRIPPSVLAQAIPDTAGKQAALLRGLRAFRNNDILMERRDGEATWAWAVAAIGDVASDPKGPGIRQVVDHAKDVADLIWRAPERFRFEWSFAEALRATERWHEELAVRQAERKQLEAGGMRFDEKVNYGPLPEFAHIGDIEFVALRSGQDLWAEGAAMKHCVSAYIHAVVAGSSRIYSIRRAGKRLATYELRPSSEHKRFYRAQLKGYRNSLPTQAVDQAALTFTRFINGAEEPVIIGPIPISENDHEEAA